MIARMIGPRPVVVAANKEALNAWRRRVTVTAASLLQFRSGWPKESPVEVRLLFEEARGSTVTRPRPSSRKGGDIDKLARAILDALQNAGVYVDDAQVVDLHAHTYYSPTPGVLIQVRDADVTPAPRRVIYKEETNDGTHRGFYAR
jgi:Holliday junction resolvase RusA-like endonuclease